MLKMSEKVAKTVKKHQFIWTFKYFLYIQNFTFSMHQPSDAFWS